MEQLKERRKIYLSDLLGSKIVTAEGREIGHIVDLRLSSDYEILTIMYGLSSWYHRLHLINPFKRTHRQLPMPKEIPWKYVASYDRHMVKLKENFHHT